MFRVENKIEGEFINLLENFRDLKDKKNHFYMISDDFEGLVWNDLPGFWNETISKSFSKK